VATCIFVPLFRKKKLPALSIYFLLTSI